ncbi:hypothetical protein O181_024074 [Austropuccinia psidii MF-1]|uniref:NAD-dependent epimerase/dehydratase domain-containing protein n=1 Tax=Austropuccinia psidii MF-1 TaxID=1389203 RepID=A0A9Q3GZB0_9BASI|nr:hypothetical protein [Austropuccinia psidii MF-1]
MARNSLVLGSTGQVGRHLLKSLLASPQIAQLTEAGRRSAIDTGIVQRDDLLGHQKLTQPVILDFAQGPEDCAASKDKLQNKDIVYIALGTTRKAAKSPQAFEDIDRGYPVLAAKLAKTENLKQTLVYCSSAGASANSPFLYPKSKGLTEIELTDIGYDQNIIFRPGALADVARPESRFLESVLLKVTGIMSCITDSIQIPVSTLGLAMAKAGVLGYEGLEKHGIGQKISTQSNKEFWLIGNAEAIKLAKIVV